MNEDGRSADRADRGGDANIAVARRALLERLEPEWPFALTLTPADLSERVADRAFIAAAARLQEEGLLMYEALLIGAGPAPRLIDAALTRRGQLREDDEKA